MICRWPTRSAQLAARSGGLIRTRSQRVRETIRKLPAKGQYFDEQHQPKLAPKRRQYGTMDAHLP